MIKITFFPQLIILSLFIGSSSYSSENFIQCDKTTQNCRKCATNFHLIQDLVCEANFCLVQNCLNYDSSIQTQCILCQQGYILKDKKCIEDISIYGVIKILIGIVVFIIIYFCFMWCMYLRLEKYYVNNNNILFESESTKVLNQQIISDFNYDFDRSECAICLMNETDLILACNHYFHLECFIDWTNIHIWCPVCKSEQLDQVKLILCMNCKNKCVVGTRKQIKTLEIIKTTEKCFCQNMNTQN